MSDENQTNKDRGIDFNKLSYGALYRYKVILIETPIALFFQ